jgi:hypothetical protein
MSCAEVVNLPSPRLAAKRHLAGGLGRHQGNGVRQEFEVD